MNLMKRNHPHMSGLSSGVSHRPFRKSSSLAFTKLFLILCIEIPGEYFRQPQIITWKER